MEDNLILDFNNLFFPQLYYVRNLYIFNNALNIMIGMEYKSILYKYILIQKKNTLTEHFVFVREIDV